MKNNYLHNRVQKRVRVVAGSLASHPGAWRHHSIVQQQILTNLLQEIGPVDALLAYNSERNNGALTLIDGYLRQQLAPTMEWDVDILDLNDIEADKLIFFFDQTTALASRHNQKFQNLGQGLSLESRHLRQYSRRLLSRYNVQKREKDLAPRLAPQRYAILVECQSEREQLGLLQRCAEEGLTCRSLIA